ncbi:carbohydrate ABC transporter permease [Culicoidibacter larvae]|uniref:Carbohydrate ABC transporter permease n=1 Tax=Culicoidibacter larvae TaxID=2579976 RepID=A0A5R8QA77_9FIRM|nr:carbohydrate ABC transporter permease [Culicoidibacter larvae]TLG72767.1 carbohydrate ABC transporter permease [Culicoidibacter larvae]
MKRLKNISVEAFTIVLFLLFLVPFVILVINTGKDSNSIIDSALALPENWGQFITNIQLILTDPTVAYITSFVSSVIITVVSLVVIVLASSLCAWGLVRNKNKLSSIIFLVFVASMVIPFQVVMFPLVSWYKMITDATGIELLRSYLGIILAYGGFGVALSVFLYHGFIKSIPLELEEAAMMEGCNQFQLFFKIIFPILRPITVTVVILNGIWIWNDFLLPVQILGKGNAIQTLPIAVVNFVGSFVTQWNLVLTAALLAIIPIVIVYLFLQKHIIKGMVDGAVK